MPTETVRVEWIHDQVFLMNDHFGFPIVMSQPSGVNGADLLPLSVIGCAIWDVLAILRKQRQQITSLQVAADSLRDSDPPWRFRKIRVHYRFGGQNLDLARIKRAIELTETKYCSTLATLRDAVEITSDYEIVDEHESK
jgi:putative redox protein